MTQQSRMRRIGWFALLAFCAGLYLLLHLKVNAVHSEVVRAERRIVQLEQQKLLLETEFETRANQEQLAMWNRVDFGYSAPTAGQFLENERQLASFGTPRAPGAPSPIRVARADAGEDTAPFPQIVSPLTGKPLDEEIVLAKNDEEVSSSITRLADGAMRVPLAAIQGSGGR